MSADRSTYVDSSAIVKLAVREAESPALRRYLRRRRPLISSALARTEVSRALLPFGSAVLARAEQVLDLFELMRVTDRVLRVAGTLLPPELRSLDAIHLASASVLGADLAQVCTYDDRIASAAVAIGMKVVAPE